MNGHPSLHDLTEVLVDGQPACSRQYVDYHWTRFAWTLDRVRGMGARRIIEVGAHPWAMTALLIDEPSVQIVATVSAEEVMNWPDDIGVQTSKHTVRTWAGREASITNYSANVERRIFDIEAEADTVLACEVVEHLIRAPHVMFLNINRWLPAGGQVLVTTPNGLQFSNPLRRRPPMPGYRSNTYERHAYVYALDDLCELIELCGFRIRQTGYCNTIRRYGPSRAYTWLARVPSRYFTEKFHQTIYVIAEKQTARSQLPRCPRVYDARGEWELIESPVRSR